MGPVDVARFELLTDPGRPHCRVLYSDGLAASHVDLRDPQELHMDYQHRLAVALDALRPARGEPVTVVHLGGGALALPRYVAATRPRAVQHTYEIDPDLVALCRRELGGRKVGLRCGDAADLIRRCERADVVIGDAFDGTEVPARLSTPAFAAELRRVLGDGGLLLLNVIDAPPWDRATAHHRMLRDAFGHVLRFGAREVARGRRAGNVLLAASASPLKRTALERALATGRFPGCVAQVGTCRHRDDTGTRPGCSF